MIIGQLYYRKINRTKGITIAYCSGETNPEILITKTPTSRFIADIVIDKLPANFPIFSATLSLNIREIENTSRKNNSLNGWQEIYIERPGMPAKVGIQLVDGQWRLPPRGKGMNCTMVGANNVADIIGEYTFATWIEAATAKHNNLLLRDVQICLDITFARGNV